MNAFYPYSYYQASSLPVAWGASEATGTSATHALPWETQLASASQQDQALNSSVGGHSPSGSPPPQDSSSSDAGNAINAQFAQAQLYQQAYQNWNYAQGYQQAAASVNYQQNPAGKSRLNK
jgi:hypothetical protein